MQDHGDMLDASRAAPADPAPDGQLPLAEACFAWCDPALVVAFRAATDVERPSPISRPTGRFGRRPATRDELWVDAARERRAEHVAAIDAEIRRTSAALLADFRDRIGSGEIQLIGLQLAPILSQARVPLMPAWAARMQFRLRQGRVTVGPAVFVDVTAIRTAQAPAFPPAEQSAAATAPRAPAVDEAVDEATEGDVPAPRQKAGRKSFDLLIRQALQAMWSEVQAAAARTPSGQPSFRALAPKIRRQCERLCRGQSDIRLPHENTIRKNLPRIYRGMLDETGCAK